MKDLPDVTMSVINAVTRLLLHYHKCLNSSLVVETSFSFHLLE